MHWRRGFTLIRDTFYRWSDNGGSLLGAALAFYTILSVAPLLLLVLAIVGAVLGEDAASGELYRELSRMMDGRAAHWVSNLVTALRESHAGATVMGTLVLVWSGTRVFSQLQSALDQLWRIRTEVKDIKLSIVSTLYKQLIAVGLVLLVGGLIIASVILSSLAALLKGALGEALPGSALVWGLANVGLTVSLLSCLFATIYRYLPDGAVGWRDAWVGACVTAVLFAVAEYPLTYYLGRQGVETAWGAAGSLVVFLLWVYYSAQVFFLGAQFTVVYAEAHGRGVQPDPSAFLVREEPVAPARLAG
ncbi:MAG TPA: YihY/virulence factor BrkB family protein [Myxococcota bacterium]|nr:YihY/virulence factor BrkB family protein [Myxococcota bacterium]